VLVASGDSLSVCLSGAGL